MLCVYGIPEPACESGVQARNIYLYNDWRETDRETGRGDGERKGLFTIFAKFEAGVKPFRQSFTKAS